MQSPPTSKLGFFFSDDHRWLLQHIQRRLRNHADAEDTAADTFCQMLTARVDPDSIEQPRAYLSTIARRLIFDRHRRRKLELACPGLGKIAGATRWVLQHGARPGSTRARQAGEARQLLLQPHGSRRDALRVIAGLGLLGGGLWLGARSPLGDSLLADLHTGRGQRQDFTLADGSRLSLNADSAVDLQFDEQQRLVILRHGELMIQVAADPRRPLRVRTAQGEIRALGTRFLVSQEQDASRVVVLQHSVQARLIDGTTLDLQEDQSALMNARHITPVVGDQRHRADWLSGRLNVLAETLPIRVDRYSPWLTLIRAK